MPIRFFIEGIDFKVKNQKKIKAWISSSINKEGKLLGDINYIFCSDEYLLNINREFLNHDTLTDIITFENSEKRNEISGDIYISVDRVKENAIKYKCPTNEELLRVVIHGVLHLCGYQDKGHKDANMMRKKEAAYLSLWKHGFT